LSFCPVGEHAPAFPKLWKKTDPEPRPTPHHTTPSPNARHFANHKNKQDTIAVSVVEKGTLTNDSLGAFSLRVPEVVRHRQRSRWTKAEQAGYYHRRFPLVGGGAASSGATLEVEIEFLPYW